MAAIETQGLAKSFRTRQGTVEAVCGVTIQVEQGEIFGLLGPNGAGKSTTMRMLATLLPLSAGTATVVECDLQREPKRVRQRIGYVGQHGGAEEAATGRENLVLQAQLYGMRRIAAVSRAHELVGALDMKGFAERRVSSYSGGQRRRLDIALGIAHRPALLFLDEPTTGLDPQSRARLWEEVRKLRESGTTVFLTTHYLDEADALCDRLAIIDHGHIVAEGTPASLKQQLAGDTITLDFQTEEMRAQAAQLLEQHALAKELHGSATSLRVVVEQGERILPLVLRVLDTAKIPLQGVAVARPTLDDVFLQITGRTLRDDNNAEGSIS